VNDEIGGGDGWRIGEVGVLDGTDSSWGAPTVMSAESIFETSTSHLSIPTPNGLSLHTPDEDEDEDDDYWAQYDKTPGSHTPAPKHSPAPQAGSGSNANEDEYYAQYASVQPAMDNHDPDEAQEQGGIESTLGRDEIAHSLHANLSPHQETTNPWSDSPTQPTHSFDGHASTNGEFGLAQPRPSSSAGSSGSETVERLERRAAADDSRGQNEVGIRQHIGTSVKSLYRLAKGAGIERREFERLIKTELEMLSFMDEDD